MPNVGLVPRHVLGGPGQTVPNEKLNIAGIGIGGVGKPINGSLTMARSAMPAILGRMATHSGQKIAWVEALASDLVPAPKSYACDAEKRPIPPSS